MGTDSLHGYNDPNFQADVIEQIVEQHMLAAVERNKARKKARAAKIVRAHWRRRKLRKGA